jgi:hypothetical protein
LRAGAGPRWRQQVRAVACARRRRAQASGGRRGAAACARGQGLGRRWRQRPTLLWRGRPEELVHDVDSRFEKLQISSGSGRCRVGLPWRRPSGCGGRGAERRRARGHGGGGLGRLITDLCAVRVEREKKEEKKKKMVGPTFNSLSRG